LLHQARVQGAPEVEIITGRGLGNAQASPVLRTRVEAWLLGPEGRRNGALSFQRQAKGGALRVKVQRRG
jgi:DNA-nicking Smr family endonuclease